MNGMLHHPTDSSQWKINRLYSNFKKEARNLMLGIATDGMNPFGSLKLVRKIVSVKKIQGEALPLRFRDVSMGDFVKIFNRSSSFIVRSSSFFGLQPISSQNQTFQFFLCTLRGPHLFRVLLFPFHLLSVPPFDAL